jgi:hypothetical protein
MSITGVQGQRMLPKQKGLELNAGTFSNENPGRNYYLNIAAIINGKNGNYKIWAVEYAHQYYQYKGLRIPHQTFSAEGGYSFFLFGDTYRNIAINAALTAVAGYENINKGEAVLFDGAKIVSADNFLYGAGGRLSFETYLSDYIVLLLQGRVRAFWGTDLEQFRTSVGIGLRFNF